MGESGHEFQITTFPQRDAQCALRLSFRIKAVPSTLLRSATLLARHPHTVSTFHPFLRRARRTRSSRFLFA
jgi:hypothetical protein